MSQIQRTRQAVSKVLDTNYSLWHNLFMSYSRQIEMPKTKQEGLANFVQLIINQLERGESNEALLTAVDLWNDVTSAAGIYKIADGAGAKLAALQSELQQKHIDEMARASAAAFDAGKAAARREMAERLGLVAA